MNHLQRTLKFVIATLGAIYLAQVLNLAYATSAGVIALLSVLETRKSTVQMAKNRFLSALLGFVIALGLFYTLGYSLFVIGLFLCLYVPLAYHWQLASGIAPITVLVLHLFNEQSISVDLLINEWLLLIIGLGSGMLTHLYMPSKQKIIDDYHLLVEGDLKAILIRLANLLKNGKGTNDGQLVQQLEMTLKTALNLVYQESDNQLFASTNYQVHYFEMRREQLKLLKNMALNIQPLDWASEESRILADLFVRTADQLSQTNDAYPLIADIQDCLAHFRARPLPTTRKAFENRAVLFQLLGDLTRFIQLKVDFYSLYFPDQGYRSSFIENSNQ